MWVFKLFTLLLAINISTSQTVCGINKKCVKSYRCPAADVSQTVEECGYKKGVKYVCCSRVGLEAYEKCEKYSRKTQQFRLATQPGEIPQLHNYPFLAALGYGEERDIKWKCTGSLISSKYVLTSAHCLNHPEFGRVKFVRMGTENFNSSFDNSFHFSYPTIQDFKVVYFITHPDYNPNTKLHDIAVLKLNRKVRYSNYAQPACLETNPKSRIIHENLSSVGWGLQNDYLKLFRYPHNLINQDECVYYFKQLEKDIDVTSQFCLKNNNTLEDICQRYSGEPVVAHSVKFNMPTVVGIGSYGTDCNTPGVYTDVSRYTEWIESII